MNLAFPSFQSAPNHRQSGQGILLLRIQICRITLLLLLALPSLSGSADRMYAQRPQPTYPVRGTVVDSLTHQPISRALVAQGSIGALTDEQGHFEIELPEGSQPLEVYRPGYRRTHQDHTIKVGANMPDLAFDLTPQITVSGQVLLSTGEPAEAVRIVAYRKSIVDNNREQWVATQSISTNADGAFHIPSLERGGSYIFCSQPAQEDSSAPPMGSPKAPPTRFGYASACFPGPLPARTGLASDRNSANSLVLTPGQHAEVELSLTREPFYHVTIGLLHPERWPNAEFHIRAASDDNAEFPVEGKPALGTVEAYLPNGQYYAEAFAPGEVSAYAKLAFRVANKPLTALSMTAFPLNPIPVEIHRDFTAPVTPEPLTGNEMHTRIAENDQGLNLVLIPAEDAPGNFNPGGELSHPKEASDPSSFVLTNASPGRYWVETYPFESYVGSITSGGIDLTRQPLTIGPGNSTAPIVIHLRNDVGRIQVTVTFPAGNSQPSALGELRTYYVYAFPLTRIQWQIPQSQGQGSEPETIEGLAPGSYRVIAFDHPQEFNMNDPEAIARLASLGETVTVSPGATSSVQLTLAHASDEEPAFLEVVE